MFVGPIFNAWRVSLICQGSERRMPLENAEQVVERGKENHRACAERTDQQSESFARRGGGLNRNVWLDDVRELCDGPTPQDQCHLTCSTQSRQTVFAPPKRAERAHSAYCRSYVQRNSPWARAYPCANVRCIDPA